MADAIKKAAEMKSKTEEFQRLFNMPATETVIQDYRCNYDGTGGRLFISQNYICFHSRIPSKLEAVAMRKIEDIRLEGGLLWSGIALLMADKSKIILSSLYRKEEVFELITYIWNNPPSYVTVPKEAATTMASSGGFGRSFGGRPSFDQNPGGQDGGPVMQQERVRVDVDASKRALRTALEARDMGTASLVELQAQAETIDRIEANVESIHANLEKADKLIRGMESLPAYIGQKFRKKGAKPPPVVDPPDRTIKVDRTVRPMDIEILCKNKNDSFTPAILRLFKDSFACIDATSGKPLTPDMFWSYDWIDSIVMRARHEHMDIRFFRPRDRFRCMSSYMQLIVNEIYLRTKGQIKIVFEPGVKEFEYGNPRLSVQPVTTRNAAALGFVRTEGQKKVSELLSANADPDIRADLDETDRDLDQISDLLGEMNDQAGAMGTEIERQTEQIQRVGDRTDKAIFKIQAQNRRMEDLMK